MPRNKGVQSPKANEAVFPYIVEIAVPLGGLGKRLDAMFAFHGQRGIASRRGRSQRLLEQDFIRWCFADVETANAFMAEFGGRRVIPPMPKDDPWEAAQWAKKFIQGE